MSGMSTSLCAASAAARLLALAVPRLCGRQDPDGVGRVRVPVTSESTRVANPRYVTGSRWRREV